MATFFDKVTELAEWKPVDLESIEQTVKMKVLTMDETKRVQRLLKKYGKGKGDNLQIDDVTGFLSEIATDFLRDADDQPLVDDPEDIGRLPFPIAKEVMEQFVRVNGMSPESTPDNPK